MERLGLGENFDKIVARAARKMRDGDVFKPRRAAHDLVERAVAAAGVDAQLFVRLGGAPRDDLAVARLGGQRDLVFQLVLAQHALHGLGVFLRMIVFSRRGIDDEQMLHGAAPSVVHINITLQATVIQLALFDRLLAVIVLKFRLGGRCV